MTAWTQWKRRSRTCFRKMNIRPNVHNIVVIVAIAVLGILVLRLAAKTQAAQLPVVGQVLRTAATA